MNFYSARLLLVILIDDRPRRTNTWDEIIVTFRARDFAHAFARALEVGRSHETEYENLRRQRVRWALVEVLTLDFVGRRVDGAEVASRMFDRRSKEAIPFDTQFRPEESTPSQSF
ncbi:DUF4288 domain-containing protein [Paludisphaera soli]|uniref:DUF4288 domain-containing protein n=1 Tax=Paludisphaera soli TaxID=2712865 RepID=UPI0013EC1E26|nr:DUF4288 domain-containing protein [Paludisphaera soli]